MNHLGSRYVGGGGGGDHVRSMPITILNTLNGFLHEKSERIRNKLIT